MKANFTFRVREIVLIMGMVLLSTVSSGQACDPNTPTFTADLSASPSMTWVSPMTDRAGNCCGTTHPDRCVAFEILLHEDAVSINFQISSGAVPPGALYYQIDCGPEIHVGEPICLDGPGPHTLTFCKPGGNENEFSITSYPEPSKGPDLVLGAGCTDFIYANYYDVASMTWTSVAPGNLGDYNYLLDCTMGCDTVYVEHDNEDLPEYVDFQVCGADIAGCIEDPICHTVRVHFAPSLQLAIGPNAAHLCYEDLVAEITANVSGGTTPYNILWNTGETDPSIEVGAGDYSVEVNDATDCITLDDNAVITQDPQPIVADAGEDILCVQEGEVVQLNGSVETATGGIWSGGTGNFIPSSEDLNARYTPTNGEFEAGYLDLILTTTGNNGCEPDSDTIRIFFVTPLEVAINPNEFHLCYEDPSTTLEATVSGGNEPYTYLWNSGETTATITVGPGDYTVTVYDGMGCFEELAIATVTQDEFPIAVHAGENQDLCAEEGIVVELSGTVQTAEGVVWYGGNGTFQPDETSLDVTYLPTAEEIASGQLTLIIASTGNNGCIPDSDEVTILFHTFTSDLLITTTDVSCFEFSDGSAQVDANGTFEPFVFSWNNELATSENQFTDLSAGEYELQIIDGLGCDTTLFVEIFQPELLTIDVEDVTDVLCFGDATGSAQVSATGGTPEYLVHWSSDPAQNGMTATDLTAGDYEITVTDANGCTAETSLTIAEPELLELSFSSVSPSCHGSENGSIASLVIGGVPNYSYQWSTGSGASNIYDLTTGQYELTVTDQHGCTVEGSIFLDEPTQITATITGNMVVCPNEEVELEVVADGGTGNYTYDWYPGGETTASIVIFPTESQYYNVTVSDNNGCSIYKTTSIVVSRMNPDLLLATAEPSEICLGDSTGIFADYSGDDAEELTLNWIHCSACPLNVVNYEFPEEDTYYVVSATNLCDEVIYDTAFVIVNPLPEIVLEPLAGEACPNEAIYFANLGDNQSDWTYLWDFGDGQTSARANPSYSYEFSGSYMIGLTVIDHNGCVGTSSGESVVEIHPQAYASFDVSSMEENMLNPTFSMFNFSTNASIYNWSFGDGVSSNEEQPTHTYQAHGEYLIYLHANNEFNCPDSTWLVVKVKPSFDLYVPNSFTPDGDQFNNEFFAKGFGISEEDFRLTIFNRWGEIIFVSDHIDRGWDGKVKGSEKMAKDGVYIWVIEFKDLSDINHRKEGHVSLLR